MRRKLSYCSEYQETRRGASVLRGGSGCQVCLMTQSECEQDAISRPSPRRRSPSRPSLCAAHPAARSPLRWAAPRAVKWSAEARSCGKLIRCIIKDRRKGKENKNPLTWWNRVCYILFGNWCTAKSKKFPWKNNSHLFLNTFRCVGDVISRQSSPFFFFPS